MEMYTKRSSHAIQIRQPLIRLLFSLGIFINDLAIEIKNMGLGVLCGTTKVSILLYADDIALIAENEKDLQKMLTKLEEWCTKWQLLLNANKSKIVHFRKKNKQKSNFEFYVGISKLLSVHINIWALH